MSESKTKAQWKKIEKVFIKQTDGVSCGAIAIANCLRYFGTKIALNTIRKTLRTNKDGTFQHFFDVGINKYFKESFSVKKEKATLGRINKALKRGPVMLWYVVPGEGTGHVATLLMEHNDSYVAANIHNAEKVTIFPKQYLVQCLSVKDDTYPTMYSVRKTEKE